MVRQSTCTWCNEVNDYNAGEDASIVATQCKSCKHWYYSKMKEEAPKILRCSQCEKPVTFVGQFGRRIFCINPK